MNHGQKKRKFGRETKPRQALMRDLAYALIDKGRITTTDAKAKSLKVYIDKLVTRGKKADLASRRLLSGRLGLLPAKKLIQEIAPKFSGRQGGYTTINKLPRRTSDGSKMAVIEWVS